MICYWSIDFDFRGENDGANSDTEPLSNVDEQPQERHVPWPQIFIISKESVRSQVLAKLDKKLSLAVSERIIYSQQYLTSVSNTDSKSYFCFYDFSSKEEIPERKMLKSIYTI